MNYNHVYFSTTNIWSEYYYTVLHACERQEFEFYYKLFNSQDAIRNLRQNIQDCFEHAENK